MRVHVSLAFVRSRLTEVNTHTHAQSFSHTLTRILETNNRTKQFTKRANNNTEKMRKKNKHDQLILSGRTRNRDGNIFGEGLSVSTSAIETFSEKIQCPSVAMFYAVFEMFCECVEKTKSVCVDKATGRHTVNFDPTVKGTVI